MKNNIVTMACCGVLLLFASLVCAADELVVVTENWRPYNYLEGNEVKGISTDIVKKTIERAGFKYTISVYPWPRAYYMAQTQSNVMIYTIIRIAPRETLFKWVRPLGNGGTTSLYRLKTREQINPKTIEEAKQYTILANIDSMDHLWLKHNGFSKLETPPSVESSIRMLFSGRGDMIAFDNAVLKNEFNQIGLDPNDVVEVLPLFKTPPFMAVSLSTSDEIIQKLQKAYDELMKEGQIILVN